jgi:hypothetical protein
MLEAPGLLLLLLACFLYPLSAKIAFQDYAPHCYRPKLLNISNLQRDCSAALSLVPNTGFEVDPDDMEKTNNMVKMDLKPGSDKLFSLQLVGKNTHRINGDKVRLPAVFYSGVCLVQVFMYLPDNNLNTALFQHMYVWPQVHKQGKRIIDECFVSEPEQVGRGPSFWPRSTIIGFSRTDVQLPGEHEFSAAIHSSFHVKQNTAEPYNPRSSREEILLFRGFNVYTATGQINDNRWETPFQRPPPPLPAKTKSLHRSKPKRKFRDARSP